MEAILYVGCSRACNHLIILVSESLNPALKARLETI